MDTDPPPMVWDHRMQKVQDIMLVHVAVQMVHGRCRGCRGGAGCLYHLHRHAHYIRCREVQGLQAHLSPPQDPLNPWSLGSKKKKIQKIAEQTELIQLAVELPSP